MIGNARVAILRLFVTAWSVAISASSKLRPAIWNRVVLISWCLLVGSLFGLVYVIRPYTKMDRTELNDQLRALEEERDRLRQEMAELQAKHAGANYPLIAANDRALLLRVLAENNHPADEHELLPIDDPPTLGETDFVIVIDEGNTPDDDPFELLSTTSGGRGTKMSILRDRSPVQDVGSSLYLESLSATVSILAHSWADLDSEANGVQNSHDSVPQAQTVAIGATDPPVERSSTESGTGSKTYRASGALKNARVDARTGHLGAGQAWLTAGLKSEGLPQSSFAFQTQPNQDGASVIEIETNRLQVQPREQNQRPDASSTSGEATEMPRGSPKSPLGPPGDLSKGILFWVFLLSTIVNSLSTISTIVLAWISNNRAKAELILKQAEALREAKEKELKIRELEIQLARLEQGSAQNSALIVVGN